MAALNHEVDPVETLKEVPLQGSTTKIQNQGIEALKDIVYGSTAGMLGKYVEYPFDTVKVRLQSQSAVPGQAKLRGPLDAFTAAFRAPEGPIRSLYRGISAPLLGAAIETSSLFFSYRVAQDIVVAYSPTLRQQKEAGNGKVVLPLSYLVGCGAASGTFTSFMLTPIELIKCKMQVPITPSNMASELGYAQTKPPGIVQLITTIFRTQGVMGFWHGQLGTLIRETGGSAAWFGSYEGIKLLYLKYDKRIKQNDDLRVWQLMTAGAVAGMSYNFAFYPADTIKSRMQTEETGSTKSKTTFMTTGKELWRQSGIKGFYRGCGITVFRAAPSSAIIFSIYEGLRRYFG